jgi:serine/threonine protein kinase
MESRPESIDGRFDVLETVHRGDSGRVVKALDRLDGRIVALKIKERDGSRVDSSEVSLLLRLGPHPGLPVVLEELSGDDHRTTVVVLDWIGGKNLEAVLAECRPHRLPIAEVVDIVAQTAAVLDFLHAQEPTVIHGDVKPSNLMRTTDGRVVLVDFDAAGIGSFRHPAGSDGYVAPEVAMGGSATRVVDVYGLAATTVRLITGTVPGRGRLELPADLEGARTGIELALREALAVDPNRRTPSAGAFAASFRSAAPGG